MSKIIRRQEVGKVEGDVLAHVSANIRRLRAAAGLSQEALAQKAGLSRRMLVNLEGGDTNISLAKLATLARALGVEFPTIVADPASSTARIEEVMWRGEGAASAAILLGGAPAHTLAEMWAWSLDVGDSYEAEPDPAGWHEMVFVSQGRLRIAKEDGTVTIAAHGFAIYSSAQQYSYSNAGSEVVHFTRVVVC
jgi:transcriptional regulator with XRE-family HTH domain